MKRVTKAMVVLLGIIALGGIAQAGYVFEYTEGRKCEIGADMRLRLTHIDRDVFDFDRANLPTQADNGPAVQYLRHRTRVWGCFDLMPDVQLNIRLANEFRYYSSAPWSPNNQNHADKTQRTRYFFPDEVYIDQLYLNLDRVADSDWSVRIGRQDIMLGNGMVMLEGTPGDAGRGIYFDGIKVTRQTECDTLTLFGVHSHYRDKWPVINDQHRPLRWGDTWALGVDYERMWTKAFQTETYYIYVDVNDDTDTGPPGIAVGSGGNWGHMPVVGAGRVPANITMHMLGARVFGDLTDQVDYSVEFAQQLGHWQRRAAWHPFPGAPGQSAKLRGRMIDARLGLKAAEGTQWSPKLNLQYTHLSGEKLDANGESGGRIESWLPIFSSYPIWREELTVWNTMGQFTNMNRFNTEVVLQLSERVKLTGCYAYMLADRKNGTGSGYSIGHLFSGYLDINVLENLDVAFEAAVMNPKSYYADGHTAEWLRFQAVYTF